MAAASRSTALWVWRVVCTLAMLATLAWGAAVGFLWANETRLVFRAHVTRGVSYAFEPTIFSPVTFDSADGLDLEGVIAAAGASAAGVRRTIAPGVAPGSPYWILFCPGAGNSIHFPRVQGQLRQMADIGYNVFAFDYRGFGRTGGAPTESGLYDDAMAAYRYLTTVAGVPPSRVILAGRSLGSAVAVEVATRVPSAGVLLLSPIESVPATAARLYPWVPVSLLATNRFDSSAKVVRIGAPVVVVHAANDRLVPLEAARRLFGRIAGPKLMLVTGGGHNRAGFSPISDLANALSRFWPLTLESPASDLAAAGAG